METTQEPVKKPEVTKTADKPRKKLKELFEDSVAIDITSAQFHQAFMLPDGGGTESSINPHRLSQKGVKLRYHPGYGLIISWKGKFYFTPGPNVILGSDA